jgi:hypothetical protein
MLLLFAHGGRDAPQSVEIEFPSPERGYPSFQMLNHAALRQSTFREYAVLGSRRIDCTGRLARRPSESGDREATFLINSRERNA